MQSSVFNLPNPSGWPLFTTVEEVRAKFPPGTAVMVAIGGWGDTQGFSDAARTEEGRRLFARNVRAMVDDTGADGKLEIPSLFCNPVTEMSKSGVDIDWEYPVYEEI